MTEGQIRELLDALAAQGNLRALTETEVRGRHIIFDGKKYLNLSSNDYLGLTDSESHSSLGPGGVDLQKEFFLESNEDMFVMGNPSSRLMTGNIPQYRQLEESIERLYPGRRALVLGSGYAVNTGLLPALTQKGDLLLADKSSHASLIDGLRLCDAQWTRFRHNDMDHLESILRRDRDKYRNVWVVTESVFSMDGDCAPLQRIVELKQRYGLQVVLDEAHSFGIYGSDGSGSAAAAGLADQIDVIVAPLGKAAASTGGFVVTNAATRELLLNRMRTLIFSTALPAINLLWSRFVIERMPLFGARRDHLLSLAHLVGGSGATPIIPIQVGDSSRALKMVDSLKREGWWTTAIRHPTVPRGSERVRISLSAAITTKEAEEFRASLGRIAERHGVNLP